jgi:hypothetical protein
LQEEILAKEKKLEDIINLNEALLNEKLIEL